MQITTLTGWGQDACFVKEHVFPEHLHLNFFTYSSFDADDFFEYFKKNPIHTDILVGWSLGGQIAARLVENGSVKTKLLVLIAAPFQFVADAKVKSGMKRKIFEHFQADFGRFPDKVIRRFKQLITHNDVNKIEVEKVLDAYNNTKKKHKEWMHWLEVLGSFSATSLDFANFPRTVLIHGMMDSIVKPRQSERYLEKIEDSRLVRLTHCGHAPHLHDPEGIRQIIESEMFWLNKYLER